MNTLTRYGTAAMSLTAAAVCFAALPVHAQDTVTVRAHASRQESAGVVTGLAIGAVAGGPIGAIVGAAAGGWLGDRYHREASARAALAVDLHESRDTQHRLASNVTELNGSLAHEQERGAKLDQALSYTNEVQTEVNFRTNDDSIQTQSLAPLMKIGALAAALPDARVRVSGYADPRGTQAYNDELSKKRAQAVAAVLTSAGLPEDRLIVESHGSSYSTAADGDLDAYAFDRHVSVKIERAAGQSVARND